MTAFLLKVGASLPEAQDSAQHALTAVFTRWEQLRSTKPAAYARTVALRHYLASRARSVKDDEKLALSDWASERAAAAAAEHSVIIKAEQRRLIEMMQELPFGQRRVLALYIDGFSTAEIADITRVDEGTVRSHLRHARAKVKTLMTDRQPNATTTATTTAATTSKGRRTDDERAR
ncbi:sigma-70 family RNA polymerase sigma factor [Dactylosporangium sp. NPDC050688]|uniref:RNA polymerase sigma factor n=1 Tax=Dactylosporangium sp. NPDC050688 TaxID=3157217 RepID=UPI0033E91895